MIPARLLLPVAALSAFATAAYAHKTLDHHTHCLLNDKGVAVDGQTDAERKVACGRIAGAVWDDTQAVPVEVPPAAAAAPPAPK